MENVILRIAYRNLWKHKIKTFIIGILVALGILILVVGNSFMDSAAAGLRKAYIENNYNHKYENKLIQNLLYHEYNLSIRRRYIYFKKNYKIKPKDIKTYYKIKLVSLI